MISKVLYVILLVGQKHHQNVNKVEENGVVLGLQPDRAVWKSAILDTLVEVLEAFVLQTCLFLGDDLVDAAAQLKEVVNLATLKGSVHHVVRVVL